MKLEIVIRPETSADIEAIAEVTRAAFETLEISNQTEPFIIEALRSRYRWSRSWTVAWSRMLRSLP